jgi:hypothetical protein
MKWARIGVALVASLLLLGVAIGTVLFIRGDLSAPMATLSQGVPSQNPSGTPPPSATSPSLSPSPSASPSQSPTASARPASNPHGPVPTPRHGPSPTASPVPSPSSGPCPAFLLRSPHQWRILDNCQPKYLTGLVLFTHRNGDGDWHVNVLVDPPFRNLLVPANYKNTCSSGSCGPGSYGGLPVMICEIVPTSRWAPSPTAIPAIGQRIWIAGTYILDIGHLGWAELHPVYSWHLI